jgi:hypothetical protein
MPRRVITDQVRQFISSDFKDAVKSLGAELRHTGTAAHWQNGQAERFIGDLGSRLTACLQEASVSTLEDRNEVAKVFVEKLTDIVFAHNQWPRAAGASPASMVFAYPTWIDIGLVKYRPFREKFLFDLDPGNLDAARKELSDGPKVGELWKVKSFTPHKKGEPRYELVRIISAEGQGDFYAKLEGVKSRQKRLSLHQLLERIDSVPKMTTVDEINRESETGITDRTSSLNSGLGIMPQDLAEQTHNPSPAEGASVEIEEQPSKLVLAKDRTTDGEASEEAGAQPDSDAESGKIAEEAGNHTCGKSGDGCPEAIATRQSQRKKKPPAWYSSGEYLV